jgi:ribosomal protein L37AE/L43A
MSKQSEGEWETFPSIGTAYRCSHCKGLTITRFDYCPNCGAKMKGGGE